jgi:hypothetical protein
MFSCHHSVTTVSSHYGVRGPGVFEKEIAPLTTLIASLEPFCPEQVLNRVNSMIYDAPA